MMSEKKPNKIRLKYINPLFWLMYFLVVIYRFLTKPFLSRCRFYPTCSTYALECLKEFGFLKAIYKIVIRLGKCHPFHPGGIDHPNTSRMSGR